MITINTKKFNNDQGAPKVIATAGKKQKTVNYDLSKSSAYNHGAAAAALLLALDEKTDSMHGVEFLVALSEGNVTHDVSEGGGQHKFSF